jgi:hypothetical protein
LPFPNLPRSRQYQRWRSIRKLAGRAQEILVRILAQAAGTAKPEEHGHERRC